MSITVCRNSFRHSPFSLNNRRNGLPSLIFSLTVISTSTVHADGEIRELITSAVTATPSTIMVDGVDYRWGQGENLLLEGFVAGNEEFVPDLKSNSVAVLRRDIPTVATGELCGVFAERLGSTDSELKPGFPALADHPGVCDMSAMLMSSVINRGTLDTFTNTGSNPNNIERIDYRFDGGITAPSDPGKLALAGHVIGEKHGNNVVQMAAILTMDDSGQPAQYGPLISIDGVGMCAAGGICYGETSHIHDYAFFKSRSLDPFGDLQAFAKVTEPVAFAFLSMETLGIPAGGTYYGVSMFPHDVDANVHDLQDISSFPDDTEEPESRPDDSADIYGGSAFLYVVPSGISGRVFCQAGEGATAPKPNVPISLFRDTVADGVLDSQQDELIVELPGTTSEGQYSFLGLENGSYFIVVADRADNDAATLAVVIISSPVEDADIVLDEPCFTNGPTAVDDSAELNRVNFRIIEVLENDRNADGVVDAPDLSIVNPTGAMRGETEVQGRTVVYTVSQATRDLVATGVTRFTDSFNYTLEDDQGLTSVARVDVTIILGDEGGNCIDQQRTDCFFVETEVDGVGRTTPLACLLLLVFVVIRRHAGFSTSTGEHS